jgi:hypothetical protein
MRKDYSHNGHKGLEGNPLLCPECNRYILLPQNHAFRCSAWRYVSIYTLPASVPLAPLV